VLALRCCGHGSSWPSKQARNRSALNIGELLTTFAAVFAAELPDKTMLTSLVLTARFGRAWPVWLGAAGAFVIHAAIATAAGQLLTLLPDRPVRFGVAVLFAIGAVVLWRRHAPESDDGETGEHVDRTPTPRIVATAFGLLLVAEWGDLTQLSIASLSARAESPVSVFIGGLAALWAVAAIAVTAGAALVRRVRLAIIERVGAVIFAVLAVVALAEALR
jgi:Ca2+/H+ antiporter, TMEM165/GDT1 family